MQFKKLWLQTNVQPWFGVSAGKAGKHPTVPTNGGLVFVINISATDECSYKNANCDGFLIVLQYISCKASQREGAYLILSIY